MRYEFGIYLVHLLLSTNPRSVVPSGTGAREAIARHTPHAVIGRTSNTNSVLVTKFAIKTRDAGHFTLC